ncbi:MAG: AAA family ATPase [Clostridia bacterium]|nr:AAA family ATPase [Clostridia bacterium]
MRLISCHIVNFGVLSDEHFNFTQGLNTICKPNGWGKTTLAMFIKAMFYGLSGDRLQGVDKNEYLKYLPFNGQPFGGSLVFEQDNKKYRIERFFDARNKSEGHYALFDVQSNSISNAFSEKTGLEVFGIDADSFERSCYLPQKDIRVKNSDSLTAKLTNLIENTNDVNNCESALKLLDEQRQIYEKRGGKGVINASQEALQSARRRLFSAEQQQGLINTLNQVQQALEGQIEALEGQIIGIDEQLILGEKYSTQIANRDSLRKMQAQYQVTKQEYEQRVSQHNINDDTYVLLQQNKQCIHQIKAQSALLDDLDSDSNLRTDKPTLHARTARKPAIIISIITAVMSVALLLISIYGFTINAILGTVLIVCGAICLCTTIGLLMYGNVFRIRPLTPLIDNSTANDLHSQSARWQAIKQSITDNRAQVQDFLMSVNIADTDIDRGVETFEQIYGKAMELKSRMASQNAIIDQFISSTDLTAQLPDDFDAEQLRSSRKNKDTELQQYRIKLEQTKAQIANAQRIVDTIPDIYQEIADCTDTLDCYKDRLDTIQLTAQYLKEAKSNLQSMYLPRMQEYTNKYLSLIEDNASPIMLNDQLEAMFVHNGQSREVSYLSVGYRDLVDFCIRLALVDCLCGSDGQLIILDDPFVNLDASKQRTAINLLNSIAARYQVIYLVCHSNRADLPLST